MTENNTKPIDMPVADNSVIRNINKGLDPYTNSAALANGGIRVPSVDRTIIRNINEKEIKVMK